MSSVILAEMVSRIIQTPHRRRPATLHEQGRVCRRCRQWQGRDQYHRRGDTPGGIDSMCKRCRREHGRAWRAAHPDRTERYAADKRERRFANRQRRPVMYQQSPASQEMDRAILCHLAAGWTYQQIADRLGIRPCNVGTRVFRTVNRLGALNRTEAVVVALARGEIDLDSIMRLREEAG